MRVGILGSGLMGAKLGTLFARAGHEVTFSYARSKEKLSRLAREAGAKARAGTPRKAAEEADALLLAVHWSRIDDVLSQAGDLSGKVVVSCSLPLNAQNNELILGHTTSGAEAFAKKVLGAEVVSLLTLCGLVTSLTIFGSYAVAAERDSLVLDTNKFTVKTLTVGTQAVTYRAYEGIVYVANPVDATYQSLNIYVPTQYYEDKSVGAYDAKTAPILLPITVGGYMPGRPGSPGGFGGRRGPGGPGGFGGRGGPGGGPGAGGPGGAGGGAIATALLKGLVVAAPGARGRTLQDATGQYNGKAPACIVDLKAAVRYLRHNAGLIPGDIEKIISNGTSAGGALSALLGATGNNPDYEPYLKAIGAANAPDNIFAASCYCPITDLDNADTAYEWLFNGVNDYGGMRGSGALTPDQIKVSDQLKALFPEHLNSLRLKASDGTPLTLDAKGDGSFKEYVKSSVIASAQKALKAGKDLSGLTWMTIKDGNVTDIDFGKFAAYATRMKAPPAFDSLELRSPENNLFGTATIDSQHFTAFSKDHSADHSLADASLVKMMNPIYYIGAQKTATAPYWRIRHGTADRDTSLAVPVILTTKLQNNGAKVDFAAPWGQGHGGDYDLDELFAWINQVCQEGEKELEMRNKRLL